MRSPNCTLFQLEPCTNKLSYTPLLRPTTIKGVPLSSACAPNGTGFGHVNQYGLRLGGAGVTRLGDGGGYFATAVGCLDAWADGQPTNAASLLGLQSADGFAWQYAGPVLLARDLPTSYVGPTENDVVLLPDGKTLMVVARVDGDGLCTTPTPRGAHYQEYAAVFSDDLGRSWTKPVSLHGAGCVRPRLLVLPKSAGLRNGAVLLSGGRLCVQNKTDVLLWTHGFAWSEYRSVQDLAGAMHGGWQPHSLSYEHNARWRGDKGLVYTDRFVNTSYGNGLFLGTTSYTSLLLIDETPTGFSNGSGSSSSSSSTGTGSSSTSSSNGLEMDGANSANGGGQTAMVTYDLRLPVYLGYASVQFGFSMSITVAD
jgi:hypothetical protein